LFPVPGDVHVAVILPQAELSCVGISPAPAGVARALPGDVKVRHAGPRRADAKRVEERACPRGAGAASIEHRSVGPRKDTDKEEEVEVCCDRVTLRIAPWMPIQAVIGVGSHEGGFTECSDQKGAEESDDLDDDDSVVHLSDTSELELTRL
jgi:hypothetical protein